MAGRDQFAREWPMQIAMLRVYALNLFWRLMQTLWFRLFVRLLLLIFLSLSYQTCSEAESVAHSASNQAIHQFTKTLGLTRCTLYMQGCAGAIGINPPMNNLKGVEGLFSTTHVLTKTPDKNPYLDEGM
jgi:hypothetical protein